MMVDLPPGFTLYAPASRAGVRQGTGLSIGWHRVAKHGVNRMRMVVCLTQIGVAKLQLPDSNARIAAMFGFDWSGMRIFGYPCERGTKGAVNSINKGDRGTMVFYLTVPVIERTDTVKAEFVPVEWGRQGGVGTFLAPLPKWVRESAKLPADNSAEAARVRAIAAAEAARRRMEGMRAASIGGRPLTIHDLPQNQAKRT